MDSRRGADMGRKIEGARPASARRTAARRGRGRLALAAGLALAARLGGAALGDRPGSGLEGGASAAPLYTPTRKPTRTPRPTNTPRAAGGAADRRIECVPPTVALGPAAEPTRNPNLCTATPTSTP